MQIWPSGISDYVPHWAGGLPPDAPPRPGTAKYDEFMREGNKSAWRLHRRKRMPTNLTIARWTLFIDLRLRGRRDKRIELFSLSRF